MGCAVLEGMAKMLYPVTQMVASRRLSRLSLFPPRLLSSPTLPPHPHVMVSFASHGVLTKTGVHAIGGCAWQLQAMPIPTLKEKLKTEGGVQAWMEEEGTSLIIFLDQIPAPTGIDEGTPPSPPLPASQSPPANQGGEGSREGGDAEGLGGEGGEEGKEKSANDGHQGFRDQQSKLPKPPAPPPRTKKHLAAAPLLELRHAIDEATGLITTVHAYLNGKASSNDTDRAPPPRT